MSIAMIGHVPTDHNVIAAKATPGALYLSAGDGNLYRYVRFRDAVTYVVGHTCLYASTDGKEVTNDTTGGSELGTKVAGIAMDVMTQNYYGYIGVSGNFTVVGGGSVTAKTYVTAGTDGAAIDMVDGVEEQVFGLALEADSGSPTTFKCAVSCL